MRPSQCLFFLDNSYCITWYQSLLWAAGLPQSKLYVPTLSATIGSCRILMKVHVGQQWEELWCHWCLLCVHSCNFWAEFKSFYYLIVWYGSCYCNRMLQLRTCSSVVCIFQQLVTKSENRPSNQTCMYALIVNLINNAGISCGHVVISDWVER